MTTTDQRARRHLKTVFVSDVHLGSRFCQAEEFLEFLMQHEIDELYLVGDIIDGWRLRSRWRWPAVYHQILQRLLQMHAAGTRLYYTPGNHDEFLRQYLQDFGFVQVANQFTHQAVDGKRFLVVHGDCFDEVERKCPWLSVVGAYLYEFILWLNHLYNRLARTVGRPAVRFSGPLKMFFKRAVQFISDFEVSVAQSARQQACDGVICGHIHAPQMRTIDGVEYYNTGDWVEHCTALIEHRTGRWELLEFDQSAPAPIYVRPKPRRPATVPTIPLAAAPLAPLSLDHSEMLA